MAIKSTSTEQIFNDFIDNIIIALSKEANLKKLEVARVEKDIVVIHKTPLLAVAMDSSGWDDAYTNNTSDSRVEMRAIVAYYAASVNKPMANQMLREKAGILRTILRGDQNTGINGFGFSPKTKGTMTHSTDGKGIFQTIYVQVSLSQYIEGS